MSFWMAFLPSSILTAPFILVPSADFLRLPWIPLSMSLIKARNSNSHSMTTEWHYLLLLSISQNHYCLSKGGCRSPMKNTSLKPWWTWFWQRIIQQLLIFCYCIISHSFNKTVANQFPCFVWQSKKSEFSVSLRRQKWGSFAEVPILFSWEGPKDFLLCFLCKTALSNISNGLMVTR